jgi:glycosyltransferase involved in cell wall biosynthesis
VTNLVESQIPKRIQLIRTYYSHWAEYSGYHQFIRYICPTRFLVDVQAVPRGDNHFPVPNAKLRLYIGDFMRKFSTKSYNLNNLVAEIAALRKWWSRGFDLLHYLDGEHSLQLLPFTFRKLNFLRTRPPIVATFHQPPTKLSSVLNSKVVRQLDHVIALSPEQKSYFEQYLPESKVSLILHGINVDYYCPGSGEKSEGKFKCISVGSWLRDYTCLLEVARLLVSNRDIEFHVVSAKLAEQDVPENVHLYRRLEDADLVRMYQNSSVLFIPLQDSTANNVILEGIACGLPVVVSDLPGVKAYVPGDEAILVKDNSPEEFTSILLGLHQNRKRLAGMALCARQRALELSWRKITPKVESVYSGLLQETQSI